VVKNGNRQHTYMKMFELQPGLGFGYTNFRLVFVFDTREAMDDFIKSGWEFGGRASAAANDEKNAVGGDLGVNVAPGITLYQMTEKGAMIGLSITGAKYWRNDDLN
jgi:lipid-binding SYLF domain-containing protein